MSRAATVDLGILGPFYVRTDGAEVVVRSERQRTLLVALVVARGSALSTDRLAEVIWEADQPVEPEQALHSQVSRLRRRLAEVGGEPVREVVATHPPGYALLVEDEQVDAGRFEQLALDAEAASDPGEAVGLAEMALALWRGRPLVGFDQPFARTEASRLEQIRIRLIIRCADALLELGRARDVVTDLEPITAQYPLDEALHARKMLALYRCGRQADALAVYRELRDRLADELGLEPSTELRRLERNILQQRDEIAAPPERDTGGAAQAPGLPRETTSFVGREGEAADVAAALEDVSLVTLTGTGGVGKTRLAIRVAREFCDDRPGELAVCDLSAISDGRQVVEAIAARLGIQHRGQGSLLDTVVQVLRHQDAVVLLDNCEHVLDGVIPAVERILQSCPRVHVLATSRVPLAVAGEQVWPVTPLAVAADGAPPAAVALFRDRAHAVDARLDVQEIERDQAVRELCGQLDGLPLAIELAAARIRSLTPADMIERLDHRLELPGNARRSGPRRHRTLRAVVEWSYGLLSPDARSVFGRLSVFAGGFTREAAEVVCAGGGLGDVDVAAAIVELVDHSLVVADRSGDHARYRLLETLRLYGVEQLGDDADRWRDQHAAYFLGVAERAEAFTRGGDVARGVRMVGAELPNLRAAQQWARARGDAELALRLPSLLHHDALFRIRDEVFRWVEAALELDGAPTADARPMAMAVAASGCAHRGDMERASRLALEAGRAVDGDIDLQLRVLGALCEIAIFRRRIPDLDEASHQLAELGRVEGQPHDEAFGHLFAGFGALHRGQVDETLEHVRRGLEVATALGNADLRASLMFLEGRVLLDSEPIRARARLQAATDLADSVRNRFIASLGRVSTGVLEARDGDPDRALRLLRDVVAESRATGQWTHVWASLRKLLEVFQAVGADEPAVVLHGMIEQAGTSEVAFGVDAEGRAEVVEILRSSLGPDAVTAAEARGRTMDSDEAAAWALATIDELLENAVTPS